MDRKTRLLFSNVAVECTSDYLGQWIESRGYKVFTVQLIEDIVSGTSPSFAYVNLIGPGNLDEAAQTLHGQTLLGRSILVSVVVPLQAAVKPARALRAAG